MLEMFRDIVDGLPVYRFRLKNNYDEVLIISQAYASWDDAWAGFVELKGVITSRTWYQGHGVGSGTGQTDDGHEVIFGETVDLKGELA